MEREGVDLEEGEEEADSEEAEEVLEEEMVSSGFIYLYFFLLGRGN